MRWPALFCALGALFLSFAGDGPAVWLAAPAVVCALLAAASKPEQKRLPFAQVVFGLGFLRGLAWLFFEQTLVPPPRLQGVHGLTLSALVIGAAFLCVHLRASLEKARLFVLFVLFAAIALAMDAPPLPVLAALVTAAVVARCGARPTADLAAVFLLYAPATFEGIVRSSPAVLAAPAVALVFLAASRFAAAVPAAAGLAAVAAACAFLPGRAAGAAFGATTLLCVAAAALSRGPACGQGVARARPQPTRP